MLFSFGDSIKSAKEQFPTSAMSKIIPREIEDPETGQRITIWSYNAQDAKYTFHNGPDALNPKDGGSVLILGGVTTLQDAQETYQGLEFVSIWWDELTKAQWEAIQYMKGSLRDPIYETKFRAASNPGEKSHKDVKAAFVRPWEKVRKALIKKDKKKWEGYNSKLSWFKTEYDSMTDQSIKITFAYIPATLDDNPIKKVRDNYLKILMGLPKHLQKMYREGSWDTYEGKFWDSVDTSRNYIIEEDIARLGLDFEWEKENMKTYLSMDWGYQDYTAIYWHLETSKGVIVTYHSLYINKRIMDDVAVMVNQENEMLKVKPEEIYCPHDIYISRGSAFKSDNGHVIGETLADVWQHYSEVPDVKVSPDRKGGWANMTNALTRDVEWKEIEDGITKTMSSPQWLILKYECPNLIEEIESAQMNPDDPEDIKKGGKDHGIDSCRIFWLAHIIDPKIIESLSEPAKGTGAWIRWMNKKRKEEEQNQRQTFLTDASW